MRKLQPGNPALLSGKQGMKRDENYIRKKRRRERIGFWLAVLLLPLSILLFDGQQRLVISRYDCPVEGLPQEFEDFRIVQLSDLHGAKFGADNSKRADGSIRR